MPSGDLEVTSKLQDLIKQQEILTEKIEQLENSIIDSRRTKNLKLIKDLMKEYAKQRQALENEIYKIRKEYIKQLVEYEESLRGKNLQNNNNGDNTSPTSPSIPDESTFKNIINLLSQSIVDAISTAVGTAIGNAFSKKGGININVGGDGDDDDDDDDGDSGGKKSKKKGVWKYVDNMYKKIDTSVKELVTEQEKFRYSLEGSGKQARELADVIQKNLGAQGLVKIHDVYNNLTDLTESGILYNVEQRAYLQAISKDLGMEMDVKNKALNRLINLQRQDLTSYRMAIEASLKEFLNQNYETSQYIKNGFQSVSESLLEAQAIMTSESAVQLEAVVQKWMGSLSSVGLSDNTISKLSTAIGQLGSGNLSALSGSEMENLIVMGAAQQGLSYGQLLTEGVSGDAANVLMQGIVDYLKEIAQSGNNVVKSEYARIFGINISDLVAASQLGDISKASVSTDISDLLKDLRKYVYSGQMLENTLNNIQFSMAMDIASNEDKYNAYRLSNIIGGFLDNFGSIKIKGIDIDLGSAARMIGTAGTLLDTILTRFDGIGSGTLGSVFSRGESTFGIESKGSQQGYKIYTDLGLNYIKNIDQDHLSFDEIADKMKNGGLGSAQTLRKQYIKSEGLIGGFDRIEGLQTSGAMIISQSDTSEIVKALKTSAKDYVENELMEPDEEYYEGTDIYKLLDFSTSSRFSESFGILTDNIQVINTTTQSVNEGIVGSDGTNSILRSLGDVLTSSLSQINTSILSLPLNVYRTSTSLIEAANTVTIGNDLSNVQDIMMATSVNVSNIYHLLYSQLVEGAGAFVSEELSPHLTNPENWNWAASPVVGIPNVPAPSVGST